MTSSKASFNLYDIIMGNNEEAYPRGGEASIFNREGLLEKGQWREGERSGEHVSTAGADMGERSLLSMKCSPFGKKMEAPHTCVGEDALELGGGASLPRVGHAFLW